VSDPRKPPATARVARSPIPVAPPATVVAGWEVSGRRSDAELTLVDCTALAKVQVRAGEDGPAARALGVPYGRAERDEHGVLVIGAGPGEWLALGPPGTARELADRLRERLRAAAAEALVTVIDLTHGRALMRLTGERAADLLAKVCAIDLSDAVTPDGAAFRSSVARLVTDVVRDDLEGARSYLLHCETSSGAYLWEALLDAGGEFGIERDRFSEPAAI
jgi:heterotetrameric sarcosine oxidase gamma subunit